MLQTRKIKGGRKPYEWGIDSRAPGKGLRSVCLCRRRKEQEGASRREECSSQGSSQGREGKTYFSFVLDGEVVDRCKNIGEKWQGRFLRQKLEKIAKQLIRRWITRTRWWTSFSKNLISINKKDASEDGKQVKQRQIKFFSTPRGLKTTSGEAGDIELQDHHHRQGPDFGKKISRRPRKTAGRRRSRPAEVTDLIKKEIKNKRRRRSRTASTKAKTESEGEERRGGERRC